MISRRTFFSITIMMVVLFFLFQFFMVMRENKTIYDNNSNLVEKNTDGKYAWTQESKDLQTSMKKKEDYVVFFGDCNGDIATQVSRWCTYTKRNFFTYKKVSELKLEDEKKYPKIVVLESEQLAQGSDLRTLKKWAKQGATIVVASLEMPQNIANNKELKKFLGIRSVVSQKTKIEGVKLFKGFLLGGEVIYKATTEREKEKQDFELEIPWYQIGNGTKAYMVGMLDEDEMDAMDIENEDLPTLIWRNAQEDGFVYSICGDFMKDSTAIGILDGVVTETEQYEIYPVVNAQNLTVANLPTFSDENSEKMQKEYNRSITQIVKDIVWPALISITENSDFKMTCFMSIQMNYLDDAEPNTKDFMFYLQQLKEEDAEMGISMQYEKATALTQKLEEDKNFIASTGSGYKYGAAFAKEQDIATVLRARNSAVYKNIGTFVCEEDEGKPPVSYYDNSIILQSITADGIDYTYRDDLRMRSLESALGYTNVGLNLMDIFNSSDENDGWQIAQEKLSSNLITYWKNFSAFESTTASTSNGRARTFLNVDYSDERVKDTVTLNVSKTDSYFILRTHSEDVKKVEGGTYEKIEDDAFLIHVDDEQVVIQLEDSDLYYESDEKIS